MAETVALVSDARVVCGSCEVAETAWTRMRGLLGRRELEAGEGLLLRPAGSVHTSFMQFPIDVVFLDRDMRVIAVSPAVSPWRIRARRGAKAVLELAAGEAERAGIHAGVQLSIGEPQSAEETAAPPTSDAASVSETPAWRSPWVLALAGVLAALCVARYDADAHGFISGAVAAVLVVLAATDLKDRLVPNRVVLPAAAAALIAQLAFFSDRAAEWILASIAAAALMAAPALVRRDAVGMGDVKLTLLIGVALGWAVFSALTLGFLALLPLAGYKLVRSGRSARHEYIPLAPFLAFGTIVVFLSGGAA